MKEPPQTNQASPARSDVQGLTFTAFSAVNRERCESPDGFNHRLDSWSTSDWFTAIVGELGEAANVAKKLNRYRDGIPGNKETAAALRDKLRRELADAFVYLDLLAQALGFNIGAAAVEVFNAKSEEIGCPIRMEAALTRVHAPAEALPSMGQGWRVEVSRFDEQVVAIEERLLAGRDLSDDDKALIRGCALHLLAFVGAPETDALLTPAPEGRTEER